MLWARRIGPPSSSLAARTGMQARQDHLSWEKAPGPIRFPQRSYGGAAGWQWVDDWVDERVDARGRRARGN
ncbi:hypothetical protein JCM16408A_04520 [Methylobacterium phyllosphaerae]|jgi:hypothetical protein